MKRALFLATAALLAMLVLVPMATGQGLTVFQGTTVFFMGHDNITSSATAPASPAPNPPLEDTGGPALLLPVASLLLGSGILTYAILRHR